MHSSPLPVNSLVMEIKIHPVLGETLFIFFSFYIPQLPFSFVVPSLHYYKDLL